jgi:hypothetical protein
VWANRFLAGAIVQGTVAFAGMGLLLYMALFTQPGPARVVASGGAGTWFTVGVIGYGLVGVVGIGLSALFYQYLEVTLGAKYVGWRNLCAWAHLVVGGGASSIGCALAAWGGLQAGIETLPASVGGGGQTAAAAHEILGPLVVPLAGLMFAGLMGFFAGGVGYVTAWWDVLKRERAAVAAQGNDVGAPP